MTEQPFIKYPSVENHYRDELIADAVEHHPELETCRYVIQEKIHGTNIQITVTPSQEIIFGTRNRLLAPDQNHMGLREVMNENLYGWLLSYLKVHCKKYNRTITLYGELFGPKIQKGVDYGKAKRVIFFDLAIDHVMCPPGEFYAFMRTIAFDDLAVKSFGLAANLKRALEANENFTSCYSEAGSPAEGIVLKPYDAVILSYLSPFMIKKKSQAFLDAKSAPKEIKMTPDRENPLIPYITENRVQSMFSKEGKITSKREISKFMGLILKDALVDFAKDYPGFELTRREKTKAGTLIVPFLLKNLGAE